MKQSLIFSFALLFLIACGQEEAAQPASEAPAVAEEQIAEDVSDATENSEEVIEEAIEVVEESAAEPDDDEQAIVLAQAEAPAAAREWRYQEGKNYIRLVPTQPTVGGADKIEVAEFFWYGCPHCYNFEPAVNKWAADVPANVRFVRIPAMWNGALVVHARLYYTEEILVRNGVIKNAAEFRDAVFQEYHLRNNRLMTEGAIQNVFERFGVSADEFERTWNSFEVDQKMRVGDDLARRYSVSSVPTMVVNGKFRSGAQEAGGYPQLLEVMDELIARESMR
jgi:thiol:disulfide interchange protein DsbA